VKKPKKTQKTPKNPKKPLGWFFFKTRVFSNPALGQKEQAYGLLPTSWRLLCTQREPRLAKLLSHSLQA
jgi:hypothetical protein